jgi:arginine/lysine/ornithine decarboxylase
MALIEGREKETAALALGMRTLRRRSTALAPLVEELRALDTDGKLTQSLPELAESYLHMHLNRHLPQRSAGARACHLRLLLRLRSASRARSFGAAKDATLPRSKAGGGAARNRDAPDRRRA